MPIVPETPEEKREREERAAYRRAHPEEWPIRVYRPDEKPEDDLKDPASES
jgi:hypothetical protein